MREKQIITSSSRRSWALYAYLVPAERWLYGGDLLLHKYTWTMNLSAHIISEKTYVAIILFSIERKRSSYLLSSPGHEDDDGGGEHV